MVLRFVKSEKGKDILVRNGFQHALHRENRDGTSVWRCINRKKCSAMIKITRDQRIVKEEEHSHNSNWGAVKAREAKEEIKKFNKV